MPAILGKKIGMTRVFDEQGRMVPVTVVEAGPCIIVQRKTAATDGYEAVQMGFEDRKRERLNQPQLGHFQSRNLAPKRYLREFPAAAVAEAEVGAEIRVDVFTKGDQIVVQGRSKGKGFAGGMKRYHFKGGPMEHGASKIHRKPMSGGATDAARVFPGARRPGHLGDATITQKGLTVVDVDAERNLLLIRGAVPGANGGLLLITSRES
ncbi:MAG: 50S ribosomal protein L3 [Armatimonadetes bacterium]|nr:50S ribosomal protein L3 [Armatimonadota bacterium]